MTKIIALASTLSLLLAACGGGSSGNNNTASLSPLSGTVAVGVAVKSATITIYDADGQRIASATSDAQGQYTTTLPQDAKRPLIIEAQFDDQKIYSLANGASETVANVNQLTNAAVALVSASGNPAFIVSELSSGNLAIDESQTQTALSKIQSAIKPLHTTVSSLSGRDIGDFRTTPFDADGTQLDKLLDTSLISTTPSVEDGQTRVNVELNFNLASNLQQDQPTGISFKSTATPQEIEQISSSIAIDANKLPPKILGTLYAEWIQRMKACYALPQSTRAQNGQVVAQACKDVFYNSDPTLFVDGGAKVGSGRFDVMVNSSGQPDFKASVKPYLAHNIKTDANGNTSGMAIIGGQGFDPETQGYLNFAVVARVFNLNGKPALGAYGDQNPSDFGVNSEITATHFPLKSSTSSDYVTSGYAIRIPASIPGDSRTVAYAVLTTPKTSANPNGTQVVFGKQGSRSNLRICLKSELDESGAPKANTPCTGVPSFVQAIRYLDEQKHDSGQTPLELARVRSYTVYSKSGIANLSCPAYSNLGLGCPRTDAEIEAHRSGGLWTLVYHFTNGDTSSTLYARHPVRAMTNSELVGASGPDNMAAKLTSTTISDFKQQNLDMAASGRAFSSWSTPGAEYPIWSRPVGGFPFAWTVEAGKEEESPRSVGITGQSVYVDNLDQQFDSNLRPGWDDRKGFHTATRSVAVMCSPVTDAGSTDISCAGATGDWDAATKTVSNVNWDQVTHEYAAGSWMTSSWLWTMDRSQRHLVRSYQWYRPEN